MTPADWHRVKDQQGLTWQQLAAAVGLSQTHLAEYRAGTRPTPRKVALAVAAIAFGLPEYGATCHRLQNQA